MMKYKLGCTDEAQHVIKCNAEPIKQRYYPVSPLTIQLTTSISEEITYYLEMSTLDCGDISSG